MIKRLLTGFWVSFLCLEAQADPITLSRARSIAQNYMVEGQGPKLIKRKAAAVTDEQQNLYIFSRGENQGYVIVSGNDALPEVIGYTESGNFDEDNLPPMLRDMLQYYATAADSLQQLPPGSVPRKAPRKASGTRDIEPLMSTHWHQTWPYNNQAPFLKETTNRAVTGCVATASSQVLYYWRKDLDDRTKYDTPTYSYGDAPVTEVIPTGTPLKWDLMRDSYGGNEPEECTEAVATLMAVVGRSGGLTYGSSTSGQCADQVAVLANQFGMNGGTMEWKSSYSQSTWEVMMISDLELGRPLHYTGYSDASGGHAVVVDGYRQRDNLFHFNFGWGGQGDGYFTVDDATGMNGFTAWQGMIWKSYPKTPNIKGRLLLPDGNVLNARVSNRIVAKIENQGTLSKQGFYLYCLTGPNTPANAERAQASEETTVVETGASASLEFSFAPSATTTYTIYLCDADKNILDKISGVKVSASVADLTLKSLQVDGGGTSETLQVDGQNIEVQHVYGSKTTNVTAVFQNGKEGTLCAPTVKSTLYQLLDGQWQQVSTKTKKNVTFQVGGTGEMVFDLKSLEDGAVYKLEVAETATTNRSFDIHFDVPREIFFRMVGANMVAEASEDGTEMVLTGNFNASVFAELVVDERISRYDLTQVKGVNGTLKAANPNALFYVNAASTATEGINVVADQVCQQLDLTPGFNFQPKEDFHAMNAVYHATQAVGKFGTAVLPFNASTPSGLFARKVNELKTAYLQEVDSCNLEIMAGTPYIIMSGSPVDITATDVDVSILAPNQGTDSLQGTWINRPATATNYVLSDAETQYFEAAEGTVIPALTAYLEYNRRVRANSYAYSAKDKRARLLAQQIEIALEALEEYADEASKTARARFEAVIAEAQDTLRTQPVLALQTVQIDALEEAQSNYERSARSAQLGGAVDRTGMIVNPSFELGNKGWTWKQGISQKITSSLANYVSGATGDVVARVKEDGYVSQTVTGLEAGVYTLSVDFAADYDQQLNLKVNGDSLLVPASDFGPMYMKSVEFPGIQVGQDGTITITLSGIDCWVKVDNVCLLQTDGVSVGIQTMESAVPVYREGMFDLSGRCLQAEPLRGVFIKNGRKYVK